MLAFIEQNKVSRVVFGESRTSENKPVLNRSDLDKADRVFYRLENGSSFTLTREDTKSAPDCKPDWAID